MRTRVRIAAVLFAGTGAIVATTALAIDRSRQPDPRKAASALIAHLRAENDRRAHAGTFAASAVVRRNSSFWFAVGETRSGTPYLGGGAAPTAVQVYHWDGRSWRLTATVRGALSPAQWIYAESFTGSDDPDFAIEGCGAGDTNCLSVISDVGGHWHAVPFEYGYGRTPEVNGLPQGHLVQTQVDACSCAGGPSTFTYEAFRDGAFVPARPPGKVPRCDPVSFGIVAGNGEVPTFQFDRTACQAGWAIALGTGAGYTARVVGLFEFSYRWNSSGARATGKWRLVTLDNGTGLPAAPAIYDLPLSLLTRLATKLGPTLTPIASAARLIARLQLQYHVDWPQQNGILAAGGSYWLVAIVPAGRPRKAYSPFPVSGVIYRWNGSQWAVDGHVPHLPSSFNLLWGGGWLVSVPAQTPSAVAFARGGSYSVETPRSRSKNVITNDGGAWHVAARR